MSAVAASIAPASAAADVDSSVLGSEAEKARRAELLYSLSVQRLNHLKDEVNAARERGPDETFAYQHAVLPRGAFLEKVSTPLLRAYFLKATDNWLYLEREQNGKSTTLHMVRRVNGQTQVRSTATF